MSFFNLANQPDAEWKTGEKILLHFFIIFFGLLIVPLDWKWYRDVLVIDWTDVNFYDLFRITRYHPRFFGLEGYVNWLIAAVIAGAGAMLWNTRRYDNERYNEWYYLLRAVLRYKLSLALVAYGLRKLIPMQMPYP